MTEVRAYDSAETTARHSPPSLLPPIVVGGKEFLRFPFGENEARCFAVQYVKLDDGRCHVLLAKIVNLFETTILSSEKVILLSNSSCQRLVVMVSLITQEPILVALGVDNPGIVRLLFFIETAADGHLLVAIRL